MVMEKNLGQHVQVQHNVETILERAQVVINAIAEQVEIVKKKPSHADGLVASGKIYEFSNELSVAISFYQQALGKAHQNPEAWARLALAKLKFGLLKEGLNDAIQLSNYEPGFRFLTLCKTPTSSMTVLGEALRLNDFTDKAMEAYHKAAEIEPKDLYAHGRRAELLLAAGHLEEAVELLDYIPKTGRFDNLISALKLSKNDPKLLPAISAIKLHIMSANEGV